VGWQQKRLVVRSKEEIPQAQAFLPSCITFSQLAGIPEAPISITAGTNDEFLAEGTCHLIQTERVCARNPDLLERGC